MSPGGLIERRNANETMNAGFGGQQAVGVFTFNSERNALQSRFLTWLILEHFRFEAALLGPLEIHAQQHLGPVLRFGAACARMNRANSVAAIVVAAEQHFSLGLGEFVFELFNQRMELVDR